MTLQEKVTAWFGEVGKYNDLYLDVFQPSDKAALMELAEGGDLCATCALLKGMKRKERSFPYELEDEETGEKVVITRVEVLDGTTFEVSEEVKDRLYGKLLEVMKDCGTMALYTAAYHLSEGAAVDVTPILLELVGRGEESVADQAPLPPEGGEAARLETPPLGGRGACEKGNKWAAYALYDKYRWGDEEHGIFIDKERAKEYYDLAGDIPYKEEWDPTDEAGEEYPTTREFTLTGDAATLDGIETLIRDLSQRFGILENEEDGLGLFVPQQQLIKLLVGSDSVYYRGNVQYLERKAPDRLVITTEADSGAPLLYALRSCFENLNVEMKDAE